MITTHTSTNLSLETVLGISIKEKHGDMGNKRGLIFVLNGILIEASLFKTLPDLFVFGRRGSRSRCCGIRSDRYRHRRSPAPPR
ncbi:hypothetical protein GLYMA_01G196500v4 [Glycine max]|uniref:Uncharacterized protein n=1 Tax=Glycine max TaxID=3847 RepID=K7K4S1_SOYBN|nr:hypothetical protein GYH30_002132 [Glycine max]KRH77171.1 hypothetical protein GLYMA_01G196500v4 [Glycine max]